MKSYSQQKVNGFYTVDANENLTANDELNLVKALQTSCQS
jgi:hypothetical protein